MGNETIMKSGLVSESVTLVQYLMNSSNLRPILD